MANIDVHPDKRVASAHAINWSAAVGAGIIGGLVFAVLEVTLRPLLQGMSPWAPLHMIGAIVLGPGAMATPDVFDLKVISAAVVVHLVLAVVYAIVLAFIVARLEVGTATLVGAVYGFALYLVNFYVFTRWFPWFADARDWISILTHVVQGGLWAYVYKMLERRATA